MSDIPPVTAADPEAKSADVVSGNIEALKALFPGAFTEGKIDFDVLRQLLGDEIDDGEEKYGLNWSGKRQARRLALTPSLGTLRPVPEDSVDWDTTKNLMIEGDNLEVLKLLQKSYAGKVKLIYIDPPYNTGKDFVYPDDYADSLGNYLRRTGQVDSEGVRNSSNSDSSGRYHTDWLCMMYPRLMLARELLRRDGIIFISIDDVECANLRITCDSVFGSDNFVAAICWQKTYSPANDKRGIDAMHDNILCYAKSAEHVINLLERTEKQDRAYSNPDNDPRGPWKAVDTTRAEHRDYAFYPITTPSGVEVWPARGRSWAMNREEVPALIADNRLWFGKDGSSKPSKKLFLSEVKQGVTPTSWWPHEEVGHNDESKKDIKELFDGEALFQTPKPVRLIRRMVNLVTKAEEADIVLDFFAGSGTTGHGVMAQNAADGGNRCCIVVQLPEPLDPESKEQKTAADFCDAIGKPRNIAELTKERLRRAAARIRADNPDAKFDGGFRVYKLATSNLKTWQPGDNLEADLLSAADNLVDGRTEDDMLVELLLKQGIDLTEPVQTRQVAGRTVHAFGGGVLVVCLADVTATDAEALADGMAEWVLELAPVSATTVFFKDAGFENDRAKTNVAAILEQRLEHQLLKVRSV